ncbi:MAG: hypothetical protein ACLQGP_23260 [Isosphaeraceae bacterium]
MMDILKQSIFSSVGLACLAREKVEHLAAEVQRLGIARADEVEALTRRLELPEKNLRPK